MTKRKIKNAIIIISVITMTAFFVTDSFRTKLYGLPPVFCVKVIEYGDGISGEYYGAGYKIHRDYNITNGKETYRITLWLLPDSIAL